MIETEVRPGERSRTKVQVILVLGFGALVALIAFAGWSALQRAQRSICLRTAGSLLKLEYTNTQQSCRC